MAFNPMNSVARYVHIRIISDKLKPDGKWAQTNDAMLAYTSYAICLLAAQNGIIKTFDVKFWFFVSSFASR